MSAGIPEKLRARTSRRSTAWWLMMENRSPDHVLGYLKLDGVRPEVDGLEADNLCSLLKRLRAAGLQPGEP